MDLFSCPGCANRYLTEDADALLGPTCPGCGDRLRLEVRKLPGSRVELGRALETTWLPGRGEGETRDAAGRSAWPAGSRPV